MIIANCDYLKGRNMRPRVTNRDSGCGMSKEINTGGYKMLKTVSNETIIFENESGIKIHAYINHESRSYHINPILGQEFVFKSQGNGEVSKAIDRQREVAKMIVEVLDYIGENMGLPYNAKIK